jgi:heptosyltransferase-2
LFGSAKFLVIRTDRLGDLVLTLPLLRELKRAFPEARVACVVRKEFQELLDSNPYLDQVIPVSVHEGRPCHVRALDAWVAARNCRRTGTWDVALVPRYDVDYELATYVAYWTGAPVRIGYTENSTNQKKVWNRGFDCLLTECLPELTDQHEIRRNLGCLEPLGVTEPDDSLELNVDLEAATRVKDVLALRNENRRLTVCVAPGAGHERRMWPLARYSRVVQWLADVRAAKIIVIGSREEQDLCNELEKAASGGILNLCGKFSLSEVAAAVKACDLFIGNDSGPAHIAAATGSRVVAVSCHPVNGDPESSQSPSRFGPRSAGSKVVQPSFFSEPCRGTCTASSAHCILGVSADMVISSIQKLQF